MPEKQGKKQPLFFFSLSSCFCVLLKREGGGMTIFASLDLGEHSHAPLQIFGPKDRLFAICDAPDCSRSVTRERGPSVVCMVVCVV